VVADLRNGWGVMEEKKKALVNAQEKRSTNARCRFVYEKVLEVGALSTQERKKWCVLCREAGGTKSGAGLGRVIGLLEGAC